MRGKQAHGSCRTRARAVDIAVRARAGGRRCAWNDLQPTSRRGTEPSAVTEPSRRHGCYASLSGFPPAMPRSPSRLRSRSTLSTFRVPAQDDRVLVTGAGPVGALTVAVLRARGIEDITVSEPSEVRRRARASLRRVLGRQPGRASAGADGPHR